MVGHDRPGHQAIALAISKQETRLHDPSTIGTPQQAATQPLVQQGLQSSAAYQCPLYRRNVADLLADPRQRLCRQRISQMKSDMLDQPRSITMRQITTRIPAPSLGRFAVLSENCFPAHDFSLPGLSSHQQLVAQVLDADYKSAIPPSVLCPPSSVLRIGSAGLYPANPFPTASRRSRHPSSVLRPPNQRTSAFSTSSRTVRPARHSMRTRAKSMAVPGPREVMTVPSRTTASPVKVTSGRSMDSRTPG